MRRRAISYVGLVGVLLAASAPSAAAFSSCGCSRIAPTLRCASSRMADPPESEMEYRKRMAEQQAGGWSIFKKGGKLDPEAAAEKDPPWLAAAKKRSEERAAKANPSATSWAESPYAAELEEQGYQAATPDKAYPVPEWKKAFFGGDEEEPSVEEPPAAEADSPAEEAEE